MSNPFDFFETICCTNLPQSTERWKHCKQVFYDANILNKVQQIWVDPPHTSLSVNTMPFPSGNIGATLSHVRCLINGVENNSNVLVFEDDIIFINDYINILTNVITELPLDWDVLYLGGQPLGKMTAISPHIARSPGFYGAYAYAVSRKFLPTLISSSLNNLTTTPFDCNMKNITPNYNFYCIYPPICSTIDGPSVARNNQFRSYTTHFEKNWTLFSPGKK